LQGYNADGNGEAYISKLNPSGSDLVFSTYLGGPNIPGGSGAAAYGGSSGGGIALDSSGNIYVAGTAYANFPTTPGALQTAYGGTPDAFIAKISLAPSPSFTVAGSPRPRRRVSLMRSQSLP
jgi:hypothetical protein